MKTPQIIGSKITHLHSVDSTNNYVIGSAKINHFQDGTVVVAKEQFAGKGLDKNKWESEKGKNLTFSIVLYPEFLEPAKQFLLNKSISLGIYDYVNQMLPDEKVKIKWPNDIYINEMKVAGILINNSVMGNLFSSSVVGIGLNVNQKDFYSDAPNPVSLINLLGKEQDLNQCLTKLLNHLNIRYEQLRNNNFDILDKDYLSALYRLNVRSCFSAGNEKLEGKITGVSEYGELLIETNSGESRTFGFKEVKFD